MRLSTKARYSSRAMIELALHYGGDPVKLKDIAGKQDISIKYLEQLMYPLRINNYVKTQKGSRGGYTLSRPPEEITLYDIVSCVEGSLVPVECVDDPDLCDRLDFCVTRNIWIKLHQAIVKELKLANLAELAEEQRQKYAQAENS